jgi:hypothetical protein
MCLLWSMNLGFNIPEYEILHSHRRENLKSYNDISSNFLDRKLFNCIKRSVEIWGSLNPEPWQDH